ncbi:MAG: hypothetical protein AAF821_27315 [Cyanobacteria bacterium P01_D01_bin.156]
MRQDIRLGWEGCPPRIEYLAQPFPGAPHLPLTGSGSTDMPLDKFLGKLEQSLTSRSAARGNRYHQYVWGHHGSDDEADIYELTCWEVCRPDSGVYEAVVILYYSPMNTLATLSKHMPEFVDEYLAEQAQKEALERLVEEVG